MMNSPHIFKFMVFLVFLAPFVASANLSVDVSLAQSTENKAVVELKAKNTFGQDVKAARAWVFLFDADGKVVGNKAQWLSATPDSTGSEENTAPNQQLLLEADKESTYAVAVDAQRKPVSAKVTFSRIILADGSMPNPQKSVVPYEEE